MQLTFRNLISVVFVCCSITFVAAQDLTLSGKVVDQNNDGLPYVNISVTDEDGAVLTGTSTDEDGLYVLTLTPGKITISYSFIGLKTVVRTLDLLEDTTLEAVILLEDTEVLNEVTINVKRPTLTRAADRLIFNVANTALSEGTVLQALKSTPSVIVLDDKILVKNTEPTVFINDRRIQLSATEVTDLLSGTSASSIKSVEVITNPSAKYDADSGVIINVVMDKNVVAGYTGSIFTNYTQGVFPKLRHGMNHFLKGEKLNLFASYSYNDQKIDRVNREEINYLDNNNDIEQFWRSNLDRNTWSETHNIALNLDYKFDERNTLSLATNLLFQPYFKYVIKNNTLIEVLGNPEISGYASNNLSRDYKQNLAYDLGYEHAFKKDNATLRISTHLTTFDYNRQQAVNSTFFGDLFTVRSTAFNTNADQDIEIFTAQTDYSLPLRNTGNFDTGIKASVINTLSDLVQFDIINGQSVLNQQNTDIFDYREEVYAAYVNWSKTLQKFEISIGVRTEQTEIKGVSESVTNTQDYLEWFPTASVSYNFNEKKSVYANYKRSIQRPNYNLLNPFLFFLNDNTVVTGNPALQPVFVDHITAGVSLGDLFTFETYFKYSDNAIFELPLQDNQTNIITYAPVNLSRNIEYGFDLYSFFTLWEDWSMSAVTSFYYTEDNGTFNGNTITQDIWANYSEFGLNKSFLKDNSLNLSFVLVYSSRNLQGFQLVDRDQFFTDLAITKTVFKGKGVIALSASDLLNRQDYDIRTQFLDQNSRLYANLDNRYVRLGFRYKFGNTKLSTNEKQFDKSERDRLKERN